MYVVISKFRVANGMSAEVLDAFQDRPRQVDNEEGFIGIEVLQPLETRDEFWLITHWRAKEDWDRWYRGHSYKNSHKGIPKGLKLDPKQTEIRHFDVIAT